MSNRTYLFYFNWQIEIPFYGIMLHEIDKIIANPDNVVYLLSCDGILRNCFVNKTTDRSVCNICHFVRDIGAKPYLEHVKMLNIGDYIQSDKIDYPVFLYENIKDIKKIVYKDCFIGYGALSSYVSYTRNQQPLMDEDFRRYFNDLLMSEIILINAFEKLLVEIKIDEVYLYNGRWADVRPVYDICKRENLKINVIESINNGTSSFDRELYVNSLPHDIYYTNDTINRIWEQSTLTLNEKDSIASAFFNKRRNAEIVRDVKVYTQNQVKGKIPENWDATKQNIVIFNSSEDEFVALGREFDNFSLFENQEIGIKELLATFSDEKEYYFYLRIHPNLSEVTYGYHKRLFDLEKEFKNITVIPGDSPVSTYSLIDNANKVIVFGSTVGAEACYWGKPVILLGSAYYYFQDVAYIPKSVDEIKSLIQSELEPKPKLGASKYGFFQVEHKLYTEKITYEPYPLKLFGKTIGYGFKHMSILGSPLLFKFVYKIYLMYTMKVLRFFIKDKNSIPKKGY